MKEFKESRGKHYRNLSKDRLAKILKKKIQTTMIGAISSIEDHFGFLWEDSKNGKEYLDIFNKVRSEILDKGNHQSRNIDVELSQYEVEWLRYNMEMPVQINKGENK